MTTPTEIDPTFASPEKQEARCILREKFLRTVTSVVGKECTFYMHSGSKVQGIFKGSDIEFDTLLVDKLKTPYTDIPHSKLRASDVLYISFEDMKRLKS